MNCTECKERMYPLSPSQPQYMGGGKYRRAICETCPNRGSRDSEVERLRKEVRELRQRLDTKPVYTPSPKPKRYEDYVDA